MTRDCRLGYDGVEGRVCAGEGERTMRGGLLGMKGFEEVRKKKCALVR
jgi:hypothetical protein